jgi:hypothetical protein
MQPRQENVMSEPTSVTGPEPVTPATQPTASTPEPVVKAAALWGSLSALFITGIGVLVSVGALSSTDAGTYYTAINSVSTNLVPVATAIVGIVGLVSGVVSPLVAAFVARRKVTPVAEAPVRSVYREDGTVR